MLVFSFLSNKHANKVFFFVVKNLVQKIRNIDTSRLKVDLRVLVRKDSTFLSSQVNFFENGNL